MTLEAKAPFQAVGVVEVSNDFKFVSEFTFIFQILLESIVLKVVVDQTWLHGLIFVHCFKQFMQLLGKLEVVVSISLSVQNSWGLEVIERGWISEEVLDIDWHGAHEGTHAVFEQGVALVGRERRNSVADAAREADFEQEDVIALLLEVVVGFVASSRNVGVELEVSRRKVFELQVQSAVLYLFRIRFIYLWRLFPKVTHVRRQYLSSNYLAAVIK